MKSRGGVVCVVLALALTGCGENEPADPDSDPVATASPTPTCPNGEDRRSVLYDLDGSAIGERTPDGAVEVFLRQEGGDADFEDFELLKENEERVTYGYSDGEFELVRLYVEQVERRGWFVLSYEYCRGAI